MKKTSLLKFAAFTIIGILTCLLPLFQSTSEASGKGGSDDERMLKNIKIDEFASLLDDLELKYRKVEKDKLVLTIDDDDFDETIPFIFSFEKKKIQLLVCVPDYGSELTHVQALEFCNEWNKGKVTPKVFLDDDGDFIAEATLIHDEPISAQYVKDNFIMMNVLAVPMFFKELKEQIDE